MAPNNNGHGEEPELQCRMEEKVSYENVYKPYVDEMCHTQCEDRSYNNCTGAIDV